MRDLYGSYGTFLEIRYSKRPVSYTHLDVYKRQNLSRRASPITLTLNEIAIIKAPGAMISRGLERK